MRFMILMCCIFFVIGCNNKPDEEQPVTPTSTSEPASIPYTVVNVYPHDTSSFTQGLQWHENYLYEGTGMKGESKLMKINLKDGKAVQKISLDANFFGEGITILNNKIYQLTWQEHKIFVYDLKTFKKLKEFNWDYEGWGITNDGKNLIISTGSNNLYFTDPESMKILNSISVSSVYGPLGDINELEYVDGKIYANIWGSNYIVRINPASGAVEARIDLSGILQKHGKSTTEENVLNGIAYNTESKSFYVTGKRWPALFELKLNQ